LAAGEPCRLASLSFDGRRILVAGLSNRLLLLDLTGRVLINHVPDKPLVALALGPMADRAVVASEDGSIMGFDFGQAVR
jgi:hypothetical protein